MPARMPPRRAHTKSRKGCDNCKSRRVKCDETGPPCANCIGRALTCTYTRPANGTSRTSEPAKNKASRNQSQISIYALGDDDTVSRARSMTSAMAVMPQDDDIVPTARSSTTMFELHLLHIYVTTVSRGLSDLFGTSGSLWQSEVVQLAFKHDYLLNGIFLLATLHEAAQDPASSKALRNKGSRYLVAALGSFRAQLEDPSTADPDALFAMSIIIVLNMLVRLQQLPEGPDLTWECLSNKLIDVCGCLRGARKLVVEQKLYLLPGRPFTDFLKHLQDKPHDKLPTEIEDMIEGLHSLNAEYRDALQSTVLQYNWYNLAIENLRTCWMRRIFVFEWLNDLEAGFLADLQEGNPFARLVITYWALSMCSLDDLWWTAGVGRKIVNLALGSIETADTDLQALLQRAGHYARIWQSSIPCSLP